MELNVEADFWGEDVIQSYGKCHVYVRSNLKGQTAVIKPGDCMRYYRFYILVLRLAHKHPKNVDRKKRLHRQANFFIHIF